VEDFTYDKDVIETKREWALAFRLSEVHNDNAPIGWTHYIGLATWLFKNFNMNILSPSPILEDVQCPECLGPMVSRKNRTNGEVFWGCKKYPECKGTRDSQGRSRAEREAEKNKDKEPVNQDPMFRFERR
jgi:hypothetical protein